MYQIRKVTIALALVSVVFMSAASAAIIGDLKTGSGGTVTVSLSSITFNPDPSSNPAGPPWNGEVATGTNLQFFGCPGACLVQGEAIEIANGIAITLSGGLGPNNPFLSFAGNTISHAPLLYTVLSLGPGSTNLSCSTLGIGDSCSVFTNSPILLTRNATGTTVTLAATGTATDGHGGSNWLGAFQVPIAGKSPEQIVLDLCPGGDGSCTAADFARGTTETSSQSGDFVASTVPEPGTISMALIGLGLGALSLRRRKNRA